MFNMNLNEFSDIFNQTKQDILADDIGAEITGMKLYDDDYYSRYKWTIEYKKSNGLSYSLEATYKYALTADEQEEADKLKKKKSG